MPHAPVVIAGRDMAKYKTYADRTNELVELMGKLK
jgi:hypothetical protein